MSFCGTPIQHRVSIEHVAILSSTFFSPSSLTRLESQNSFLPPLISPDVKDLIILKLPICLSVLCNFKRPEIMFGLCMFVSLVFSTKFSTHKILI